MCVCVLFHQIELALWRPSLASNRIGVCVLDLGSTAGSHVASRYFPSVASQCPLFRLHCGCFPLLPVCGFPVSSLSARLRLLLVAFRCFPSVASQCSRIRLHNGCCPLLPVCGFPASMNSARLQLLPVVSCCFLLKLLSAVRAFFFSQISNIRMKS